MLSETTHPKVQKRYQKFCKNMKIWRNFRIENVENESKSLEQPWRSIRSNTRYFYTKDESSYTYSKHFESIKEPSRENTIVVRDGHLFLLSLHSLLLQFWLSDKDGWPRHAQSYWRTHWAKCSASGPYWMQFVLWTSAQRKDVETTHKYDWFIRMSQLCEILWNTSKSLTVRMWLVNFFL